MNKEAKEAEFNHQIALMAQTACILEVDAPKVGNVNRYFDFSDASLEDFHLSALAIGRSFGFLLHQGVGKTVYEAVKATRSVVLTNTNLGIVLLLAPLGMAWCRMLKNQKRPNSQSSESKFNQWKKELRLVLDTLSIEDSYYVYEAIRLASPSGMGEVEEHDVFQEERPSISLLEVMTLASERDLIAQQYVTGFELVLDKGYNMLKSSLGQGLCLTQAIAHTHLYLLGEVEDSLITRKLGKAWSREVMARARIVWEQGGWLTALGQKYVLEFDQWLRKDGHNLNPGTTADLIAAIIFVYLMEKDFSKIEG